MDHVVHHSIIATTYKEELANELFLYCVGIGSTVSRQTSVQNAYETIFIGTDGSKSGWPASDKGDKQRELIKLFILSKAFDDGSNPFDWVEVSYSSDDRKAQIVDSQWEKTLKDPL